MDRKEHIIAAKILKAEDERKTRSWEEALVSRLVNGEYLTKTDKAEAKRILRRNEQM